MNIKDMSVVNLFDDINKEEELNELYKKIIQEEICLDKYTNKKTVGRRTLSDYINSHLIKYYIANKNDLEDNEEKEPPKLDIPNIEIKKPNQSPPPVTAGEDFNYQDFKDDLVLALEGKILKDGYSSMKTNYGKIFNSEKSPVYGLDFVSKVKETNSLEELDNLYNNLIKDLQQPQLDKLSNDLPIIKQRINNRLNQGLPKENGFDKFINDIESNNGAIRDTRTHRYYDMVAIYLDYSDMIQYTAKIEEQLDRLYYGYYSEYYDLNQIGHAVNDVLVSTDLNGYKEFSLNQTVKDYLFKAFQSQSIPTIEEYPPLIKQIFNNVPDEAVEDKAKESYYLGLFEKPITYDKALSVMMELIEISSKYNIG